MNSDKECSRSRSPLFLEERHFTGKLYRKRARKETTRKRKEDEMRKMAPALLEGRLSSGIDKSPLALNLKRIGHVGRR